MSTFEVTAHGLGAFAIVVGLIVVLMERWDSRRTSHKYRHA